MVLKPGNVLDPNLNTLKNGIPVTVQILVRRIPIEQVPTENENECATFLYKLFEEKVWLPWFDLMCNTWFVIAFIKGWYNR